MSIKVQVEKIDKILNKFFSKLTNKCMLKSKPNITLVNPCRSSCVVKSAYTLSRSIITCYLIKK